MIFLGWDKHMLLLSSTLQGQVAGWKTKAHILAKLQVREDLGQAGTV